MDPSEVLMCEAFSTTVVDTACTKKDCGQQWLNNYIDLLDDDQKLQVKRKPSDRIFRFRDGQQVHFEQQVTIPATTGGTKCTIETDVVESKLPLLLSKNSLKKAQTVLDMNSDTAKMFGQPVELFQTSSGNYRINPCISRPPIFDGKKSNFLFFVQCYWDTNLVFFDFWKCGYTKKSGPQALNSFVVQLLLYMRAFCP